MLRPEITEWILLSLFWLGLLVALLGIFMVLFPGVIVRSSGRLNRWISTEPFFNSIDRPRRSERLFYRYHHIFGGLIVIGAAYCLLVAIRYLDETQLISALPVIVNREVSSWLYTSLHYVLIAANAFALVLGFFVLIRPSLIKDFEMRANRWFGNEKLLQPLDRAHAIPEDRFPGNLRLFGVAVFLGGIFMMVNVSLALQ